MVDNQHRKIKGYRDLSLEEISLMNEGKQLSESVREYIDKVDSLKSSSDVDKHPDRRSPSIAKTNLQTGFMWLIRSIAKPETF